MQGIEKRQSADRDLLLRAMGIQPWYLRTAAAVDESVRRQPAAPAPQAEPAANLADRAESLAPAPAPSKEPAAVRQTLQFCWVRGASGMLLCELGASRETLRLARDIVVYGDWLRGRSGAIAHGEFQWPQLVDSGGTAQRAMQVLLDKHLPAAGTSSRWLAAVADVAEQFDGWQDQLGVRLIVLPRLTRPLGNAADKKAIWQAMSGA